MSNFLSIYQKKLVPSEITLGFWVKEKHYCPATLVVFPDLNKYQVPKWSYGHISTFGVCVCVCVFGKSSINKEIVIALITKNRIPENFYYRDLILLARLTCLCKSSFGDKCSTDSPACKQVNKKNHLFNSIIEHQLPSLTTQLHWISRYISTDYIPIQDMWILAHNSRPGN